MSRCPVRLAATTPHGCGQGQGKRKKQTGDQGDTGHKRAPTDDGVAPFLVR